MRLFFALWPPAPTAAALHAWAGGLDGRATRSENVHLTLAFLGEADERKAAAAAARATGRKHDLPIERAEYWRHNRIVWVGPAETPAPLHSLVTTLHSALKTDGFRLEDRPFAAHVTLLRNAKRPAVFPALPAVEWPVGEFSLVAPVHGRYRIVDTFQLR